MAAAKKPGLALVIAAGGKPKGEAAPESDDSYGAAVDELADVLGVPDDKLDAFREAFEAACMACK
jgi:hypothetical protein